MRTFSPGHATAMPWLSLPAPPHHSSGASRCHYPFGLSGFTTSTRPASATRLGKPGGFCGCGRQRVRKRRPATLCCTVPEEAAGLHDHATPGRVAEAGERGRSKEPATATPRSQTQPGGHKALQRRPSGRQPLFC
ncbi:hypothetical protein [Pectobacterium polaris]|uniref:hypothetical protein n=1 Tax=Pectobacterium polaris TaxID=2042057 RepID=UPI0015E7ED81|nr:hypothetical protein [Pectobacterium polaris]